MDCTKMALLAPAPAGRIQVSCVPSTEAAANEHGEPPISTVGSTKLEPAMVSTVPPSVVQSNVALPWSLQPETETIPGGIGKIRKKVEATAWSPTSTVKAS